MIPSLSNSTIRKQYNADIISLIIDCINGFHNITGNHQCEVAYKYLLNQTIRQYIIPQNHWYISNNAKQLWNSLTTQDIKNYAYQETIICNKIVNPIQVTLPLKGTIALSNNAKVKYNSLFHDDHIIPVKYFENVLLNIQPSQMTNQYIGQLLDGMYIAKLTKLENSSIKQRSNRPNKLRPVVTTIYAPKNININKL